MSQPKIPTPEDSDIETMLVHLTTSPLGHPIFSKNLYQTGLAYIRRYLPHRRMEDLHAAVLYAKASVEATPPTLDDRPLHESALAFALRHVFARTGDLAALDGAIHHNEVASAIAPPGHPAINHCRTQLQELYVDRFKRYGRMEDVDLALLCELTNIAEMEEDDPRMPVHQTDLAMLYQMRFQRGGDLTDLEAAIAQREAALQETSGDDPKIAGRLSGLAGALQDRYRRLGDVDDLNAAVMWQQTALASTSIGDTGLAARHAAMGILYTDVYQRFGSEEALNDALDQHTLALVCTPDGSPDLPVRHGAIAVTYSARHERSGKIEDLNKALHYDKLAVKNTPAGAPELPERQASLATTYRDYFTRLGNVDDLDSAVHYQKLALNGTPPDHPDLRKRQAGMGLMYADRFKRFGIMDDLEKSIELKHLALQNTPQGHPDLSRRQAALATALSDRFGRSGDLADLDAAMEYSRLALENTPENDMERQRRQDALGAFYSDKYQADEKPEALESAIEYSKSAVTGAPENHPDIANFQARLSSLYTLRYQRHGAIQDLEESLKMAELALKNMPPDNPDLPALQTTLGNAYTDRFRRLDNINDLEAALNYNKLALEKTPSDHPMLPRRHAALAFSHKFKYRKLKNIEDLDAALKHDTHALEKSPPGHHDLFHIQSGLADSYKDRYERHDRLEDLEAALKYFCLALEGTPASHPDRCLRQSDIARLYNKKHENTQDPADYDHLISYSRLAIASVSAHPGKFWAAATSVAVMVIKHDKELALDAFSKAFEVLPDLIWIGNSVSNRHFALAELKISVICSSAALVATHLKRYEVAVEFMERGLSITHRQSLQLKLEDDRLAETHPQDAERLKELSVKLLHVGEGLASAPDTGSDADVSYHALAVERNNLIAKIRAYEGFDDFLQFPSYKRLSEAAAMGPVIYLNCTPTRSDALVILAPPEPPQCVPLPEATPERAAEWQGLLRQGLHTMRIHSRNVERLGRPRPREPPQEENHFKTMLDGLRKSVVEPVFECLETNNIRDGRLWWCTSGQFTALPIHAAASIDSPFIQSYTSSLQGLLEARRPKASTAPEVFTAVGITEVPGYPPLFSVDEELAAVAATAGGAGHAVKELRGTDGTIERVLAALQTAAWVHLACHGTQDAEDPLRSGLVLADGTLELGRIMGRSLPAARFIFLSACETAMGDRKLVDEAMHLAGGFIAAGFQSAIGTLWSMNDSDGPTVARVVYRKMYDGVKVPDVKLAADGLHLAVQELRRSGAPYHRWVPFVHFGV